MFRFSPGFGITRQNRNANKIKIKEKKAQNSITWQELQIMHFPKKRITKAQILQFSPLFLPRKLGEYKIGFYIVLLSTSLGVFLGM